LAQIELNFLQSRASAITLGANLDVATTVLLLGRLLMAGASVAGHAGRIIDTGSGARLGSFLQVDRLRSLLAAIRRRYRCSTLVPGQAAGNGVSVAPRY
jgi:hypothetical protein